MVLRETRIVEATTPKVLSQVQLLLGFKGNYPDLFETNNPGASQVPPLRQADDRGGGPGIHGAGGPRAGEPGCADVPWEVSPGVD